ncbi:MAG: hypothetical protein AABZ34_11730 [Nitrospirota bacterium]
MTVVTGFNSSASELSQFRCVAFLQAQIELHLHEARTLVTQAQEAADRGDTGKVERLVGEIKIHTAQAIAGSKEQKK